jgi:hypothetical protein
MKALLAMSLAFCCSRVSSFVLSPKPAIAKARSVNMAAFMKPVSHLRMSLQNEHENIQPGNILVLDHLNINHESGRHDLLKKFYFDILGCSVDPRKEENLAKGKKTLWANAGINQFHLPEATTAQVLTLLFNGKIATYSNA